MIQAKTMERIPGFTAVVQLATITIKSAASEIQARSMTVPGRERRATSPMSLPRLHQHITQLPPQHLSHRVARKGVDEDERRGSLVVDHVFGAMGSQPALV